MTKNKLNTSANNKHRYLEYQKQKQSERKGKAKEIIEEYKHQMTPSATNDADLDISNSCFVNNRMVDGQPMFEPKRRVIKFGGQNCLLDSNIAIMLVMFDPISFRKFLCLSPNWHYLVLEGMDTVFKPVECDFINTYYEHLMFKRSYTNTSVIYSSGRKGIRIDRVLVCEVLDYPAHISKCLSASFAYKLHEERKKPAGPKGINVKSQFHLKQDRLEYGADYKMDIVRAG